MIETMRPIVHGMLIPSSPPKTSRITEHNHDAPPFCYIPGDWQPHTALVPDRVARHRGSATCAPMIEITRLIPAALWNRMLAATVPQ